MRNHSSKNRDMSVPSSHESARRRHEEDAEIRRLGQDYFRQLLIDPAPVRRVPKENVRARIAAIDSEMRQMQRRRKQPFTKKQLEGIARISAERGLILHWLFPINNLPFEILQRIFTIITLSHPSREIPKARTRLTSVCTYWRTVVTSVSKLWSVILVKELPPFPLLQISLRYAQRQLLTIRVDQRNHLWSGSETDFRIHPRVMQELMMQIARFLPQVRELVILADTCAEIAAAAHVLQRVPAPHHLHRLEIRRTGIAYGRFPPGTRIESIIFPLRVFGGAQAPVLNHLSFVGVCVDFRSSRFRNLRVLEMRNMLTEHLPRTSDFFAVLKGSPRLEKLIFDGASPKLPEPGEEHDWEGIEADLPYLRELTLCNLRLDPAMFLVDLIAAPNLRRLTLAKLNGNNGDDFTELIISLGDDRAEPEGRIRRPRYVTVTELTVNGLAGCVWADLIGRWIESMHIQYLKVGDVSEEFYTGLWGRLCNEDPPPSNADRLPRWPMGRSTCPWLHTVEVLSWSSRQYDEFRRFYVEKSDTLRSLIIGNDVWDTMSITERSWFERLPILKRVEKTSVQTEEY